MLQLRRFNYPNDDGEPAELITVEINGEIWFIATALCKILDIQNVTIAVSALEEDEKLTYAIHRAGQLRNVNIVNESGLYALIFKSRKPTAKRFRQWVTKEVLPAIRKDGFYGTIDGTGLPNFITRYKENYHKIEYNYFSVISELFVTVYLAFEKEGFIIPDKARDGKTLMPDISVGLAFAGYLRRTQSEFHRQHKTYMHTLYEDKEVEAKQYPIEALPIFRKFVHEVWLPVYAEKYFKERVPQALQYIQKLISKAA